ncbi:Nudix-like NDP and NTP phosphohydrolase NudJ [Methylomonas albis]|uniref:Phosphatase NudJ n=1 Tax=Methylomonas albis TaxID=1854563 RepID=A0ABR9D335_9GAMM|nr:NUDIX hydrolase [Methylomonas albis]MBD9357530.1 NUDIX hydrolase [Methylomonas albis]CAD6880813.1 Nudix-like NDP and NTP phosphohydrolase NudJ [Methylomonas albis]
MVWKPHVTVAAVIEKGGRFLLVEETTARGLAFNQPAGHLEEGEDLINAVKREVWEETAWQFEPEALIATQLWRRNPHMPSFVRFCFSGTVNNHNPEQPLDDGIIDTHWLSRNEIYAKSQQLRSPLVLSTVDEYLKGHRYPLTILQSFIDLE